MTRTAKLYGGSLYDLAREESIEKDILEQLQEVRDIFRENPDYIRLLSEPSIPLKERCALVDESLGADAHKYLVSFIKLLAEKGHLGEFSMCCDVFEERYDADNDIRKAVVTSAAPLSESQKDALKQQLEKLSGKTVVMELKVDSSLVGGIRVMMDGRVMDGTISGRMKELSRRISEVTL